MADGDSLQKIADALAKLESAVIVAHYHPDADALGASCAMLLALRQLGKRVICVNESKVPERYLDLPGVREVQNALPAEGYQALIVCDSGDIKRVGDSFVDRAQAFPALINIDHHISNDFFGSLNYVVPTACSTAELIYDLLEAMRFKLTPDIANCIYAGIAGDTGCFKYSSTNARVFELARNLVDAGARPTAIGDMLFGAKPERQVRLEALALSEIQLFAEGRIALVLVTPEMYQRCGASSEDTEHLVELVREVKGVRIAVLIRRDDNLWKVSLRLNGESPNLSEIAAKFGGGGHKQAAAFRWRQSLEVLRSSLLAALEAAL